MGREEIGVLVLHAPEIRPANMVADGRLMEVPASEYSITARVEDDGTVHLVSAEMRGWLLNAEMERAVYWWLPPITALAAVILSGVQSERIRLLPDVKAEMENGRPVLRRRVVQEVANGGRC